MDWLTVPGYRSLPAAAFLHTMVLTGTFVPKIPSSICMAFQKSVADIDLLFCLCSYYRRSVEKRKKNFPLFSKFFINRKLFPFTIFSFVCIFVILNSCNTKWCSQTYAGDHADLLSNPKKWDGPKTIMFD